jgi:hypothetical protein
MNQEQNRETSRNLSFIYRIFCWCSGSRLYIIKQCPTDYNKFFGIGMIVFLTGIMASLTGGYAVFTVFRSPYIATIFGLFWGTVIFFLDWYLVSSLRKEKKPGKELMFASLRIILAIFISIIISKPLELKMFESEIDQVLEIQKREHAINYGTLVNKEFVEISKLEKENADLYLEIKTKEAARKKLFDMIIEEAEGRSPTLRMGKGPVYFEKKLEYDRTDQELKNLSLYNLNRIESNNKTISSLKQLRNRQIERGNVINQKSDGLLARLDAIGTLTNQNRTISIVNWFIILLFMCIECLPILVKLMSNRGPYDEILESEELQKTLKTQKKVNDSQTESHSYLEISKLRNKERTEATLKSNQEFIEQVAKALNEINAKRIENWKNQELQEIEVNQVEKINLIETPENPEKEAQIMKNL